MTRGQVALALLLAGMAGPAAAAEGWFWLRNNTAEAVVAVLLAPAAQPGQGVDVLATPLPPGASRMVAVPAGACRLRLVAVLEGGATLAPPAFDACRDGQVTLRPASPSLPPDAVARDMIDRLRVMPQVSSRGIRLLPAAPVVPSPPMGLEPLAPWGLTPPDTGPRR